MATFSATTRTLTELATSVRDARLAAGMSQAQLAEAAHLNRSWVSLFESGRTPNASLSKVLAMFSVLNITMRLTYPIPDPQEPAAGSEPATTSEPAAETPRLTESTPADTTDDAHPEIPAALDTHPEAPALLDPAALAAARAQRKIHRARAHADEMAGNPSNAR